MSDADDMENAYDAAVELTQHANEIARENERLRSQLAALQAEAARAVGPFAALAEIFNEETMNPGVSMEIHVPNEALRAARAFLSSLPSPAIVAVPIEPGEGIK